MSRQIEVDDEVFSVLQREAEPFVDTPNSVLRRKFGLDADEDGPVSPPPSDNPRSGTGGTKMTTAHAALPMTPQRDFRPVIRDALKERGGGRSMHEVLREVESRMGPRFLAGDLEPVPSTGEIRWRNAARWERMQMAKEGLIKTGTKSGWWELTEDGWDA